MYVHDWMSSPAITVAPECTARAALDVMKKRAIRRLPVLDNDKLVGIVTKTDLMGLFGPGRAGRRGADSLIVEIMKKNPVAVSPDDTVESAARILLRKRFSGLPVVDDGRVVGVITESDLFRALCRMLGIDGRGARMEVPLADDRALVNFLAHQVEDFEILNLVTVPNPREGGLKLVLRMRGRSRPVSRGVTA
jgi:acetoin utilization protein AcuB